MEVWAAWERLYGPIILHNRHDILFARSDMLLAEINRNKKKKPKPYKLKPFLMDWYKPHRKKKGKMEVAHATPQSM
ncbi:hypothetical protein PZC41_14470, partial [Staphylococcus aureus]|uniref:hypothetical protein n=1 Tax=Staphylococcus aureus TaxID=1280 RepID=UPI0023B1277A